MKGLFCIIFLLSFHLIIFSQINTDTSNVSNNLSDFFEDPKIDNTLRTYSIRFTIVKRDLDTSNFETVQFLDSLAFYLSKHPIILEIGTHISIKHSKQSARNYNNMASGITNYLVSRGVNRDQLIEKNYLDNIPIVCLSEKSKFKNEKEFWEAEWNINNRVEFKIVSL